LPQVVENSRRLASFDQLESVGNIHQSHSFVRGNWGNEERSTFMLMSKSCHDLDIFAYLVDQPCQRVSSFGSLTHFRKENAPPGAPPRCTDGCPVEESCVYSAYKVYMPENAKYAFPALAYKNHDEKLEALKTGPYGKCVYQTDNDVVDHQVVSFEFRDGVTGTFTMTAFAFPGGRTIRLHGTQGYMKSNVESNSIDLYRYADNSHTQIKIPPQEGGHGGADDNVMRNLVHALRTDDPGAVLTSTAESLASHKIVFAAEKARLEKRVVELKELD